MWVCIVISFFVVGVWLLVKAAKPTKQPKRVVRVTAKDLARATPQAERRQKQASSWESAPEPSGQIQWYGGGTTLNVAEFELRQPAIYASPGRLRGSQWATDPSEVLIAAEVRRPRGAAPEMGYWPWYSRIAPENRYQYLQWLASGKLALPPQEGLLFLYYYGLERRLLHDGKDAEWVLHEIVRLRKLDEPRLRTREGNAFRKYSTNLLWFEVARNAAMFNEAAFATICGLTHNWDDEVIAGALSWLVQHRKPLPASIARWVASMDLESRQSVVIKRSGDKFNQLFEKRYQERFGEGIPLRATGSLRRHTCRPASGGLSEVECHVADVTGENGLFAHLADIWNSCIDDLRGYTKLEVPVRGPMTADAWEAMPEELRGDADHPLAARFHEIVRAAQSAGVGKASRETLIHAGLLASQVGTDRREKLTATQSRRVATTLQHCGYNVEPDARLSGRPYGWDQPVAVFPRTDESEIDPRRYGGAVCMLQLGLTVAEADGVVEPEELRHLAERIDALFQLPPHELRRLDALLPGGGAGHAPGQLAGSARPVRGY
ncbi:MAG: TerB N-terminal domain-containing protein [Gammaproteobacteria bacterium]|nr:TerB N-terminal domain-containing protein [Gammaproteobacteria bacterium]